MIKQHITNQPIYNYINQNTLETKENLNTMIINLRGKKLTELLNSLKNSDKESTLKGKRKNKLNLELVERNKVQR